MNLKSSIFDTMSISGQVRPLLDFSLPRDILAPVDVEANLSSPGFMCATILCRISGTRIHSTYPTLDIREQEVNNPFRRLFRT